MRATKVILATIVCTALLAATASAAPVSLTLVRTSVLYNEDPPGAPLPLGRTQYDSGDIMRGRTKVGEYLRVKDVHAAGMNVAAVTITLFFPNPETKVPIVITLQGAHSFDSGDEVGSISASSIPTAADFGFTYVGATDVLTLLFP